MKKLIDIPFALDMVSIARTVHVEPDSPDGRMLRELIEQARQIARPKALYREAFIDSKGDDTVAIEGVTFTSRMLRANLDRVERVFPFVATCGHEMDTVTLPAGDFLAEFVVRDQGGPARRRDPAFERASERASRWASRVDEPRLGRGRRRGPSSSSGSCSRYSAT
jgi:hypothetical protein